MTDAKNFSTIWDFDSKAHAKEIRVNDTLEKAIAVSAGLLFLTKKSKIGATAIIISSVASALQHLGQKKVSAARKDTIKSILDNYSKPASKNIQAIAGNLFDKAGIDKMPDVRIVEPDKIVSTQNKPNSSHLDNDNNSTKNSSYTDTILELALAISSTDVLTVSDNCLEDKNTAIITIGRKIVDELTEEEIAAVLAHETSHIKISQPDQNLSETENTYKQASSLALSGLTIGTLLTGNWKLMIPFMLANKGKKSRLTKMMKLDEERADRNSIGLFPHQTALKTGLDKILKLQLAQASMRALSPLQKQFSLSNSLEQRLLDIDKFYDEAKEFYKDHGLAMETQSILGPKNKRKNSHKPKHKPSNP